MGPLACVCVCRSFLAHCCSREWKKWERDSRRGRQSQWVWLRVRKYLLELCECDLVWSGLVSWVPFMFTYTRATPMLTTNIKNYDLWPENPVPRLQTNKQGALKICNGDDDDDHDEDGDICKRNMCNCLGFCFHFIIKRWLAYGCGSWRWWTAQCLEMDDRTIFCKELRLRKI